MGFGEAISTCFRKYVTFSGRARRSEYWYFVLFGFLLALGATTVDLAVTGVDAAPGLRPASSLVTLVMFLPRLAVLTRRLHDTNRSGFWVLGLFGYIIAFAVVVGVLLFSRFEQRGTQPDLSETEIITLVVLGIGLLVYVIWLFVLTVLRGTQGPNRYGPDPLGPDAEVFN